VQINSALRYGYRAMRGSAVPALKPGEFAIEQTALRLNCADFDH
jgi:hypothetical protein